MMFTMLTRNRISVIIIMFAMIMGGCLNSNKNKRGNSHLQAGMIIDSARYFIEIKRFDKASNVLLKVTPVEDSMPGVPSDTLFLINSLCGQVNQSIENFDRAFEFYSKALKIAGLYGNGKRLPDIYMQLAGYYAGINDSAIAQQYLGKAKHLLEQRPENQGMMAEFYFQCAGHTSKRSEQENFLLKALELTGTNGDKLLLAKINERLGLFYHDTDRPLSLSYFRRSLSNWKAANIDHQAMNTYLNIIEYFYLKRDPEMAVKKIDSFNLLYAGARPDYIRLKYHKIRYLLNYGFKKY